jgi:antagonist of KipI
MRVHVIRPGLLTTVQDRGRRGYQQYGVSVGGAMDPIAARIANILVGNPENAAVLETTLHGPSLRFDCDALVAICGGDLAATIDSAAVPMWRPVWIRKDTTIEFGQARTGCRAYVAVAGGIDVPSVLNSRGTYLRASIGGHEGRALKAGDVLPIGASGATVLETMPQLLPRESTQAMSPARWNAESYAPLYTDHPTVRVLLGLELDWLDAESQRALLGSTFEITPQSDRMGYRLFGPQLSLAQPREMFSGPVCAGTIQLPKSGQPILLMADCATTGGYARVAHVASVDLPLVAQARPASRIRFQKITLDEAHELYRAAEASIEKLKLAVALKGAQ